MTRIKGDMKAAEDVQNPVHHVGAGQLDTCQGSTVFFLTVRSVSAVFHESFMNIN